MGFLTSEFVSCECYFVETPPAACLIEVSLSLVEAQDWISLLIPRNPGYEKNNQVDPCWVVSEGLELLRSSGDLEHEASSGFCDK